VAVAARDSTQVDIVQRNIPAGTPPCRQLLTTQLAENSLCLGALLTMV